MLLTCLSFHPCSERCHSSSVATTSPGCTVMTTPLPGAYRDRDMQQLDNFPAKCAVKRTDGLLEYTAQGTMWQPQALTPQHRKKVLNPIRMVIILALTIIGPATCLVAWLRHIHWWDASQKHPLLNVLLFFFSPKPNGFIAASFSIEHSHDLHKSASGFSWKSMQILKVYWQTQKLVFKCKLGNWNQTQN